MEEDKIKEFYDELPYLGNPIKTRKKDNTTDSDVEKYPIINLVKRGSNVKLEDPSQSKNDDGWTIMQLAVRKNLEAHVEILLRGDLFKI